MKVTLDKSFLDGTSVSLINDIFCRYQVLFPEILFFELLTTRQESQKRCFSKIQAAVNPVILIPNVGTLLRYEMEKNQPCNPIENLATGTYLADEATIKKMEQWRHEVHQDTVNFIERCKLATGFPLQLRLFQGIGCKTQ